VRKIKVKNTMSQEQDNAKRGHNCILFILSSLIIFSFDSIRFAVKKRLTFGELDIATD